jgi:hypothetical protein
MTLLAYLLSCDSPLTVASIAEGTGRDADGVTSELSQLLAEGKLRARTFPDGGQEFTLYWPSSLISFVEETPIITSPFGSPFDHHKTLDRLSDAQLQQERQLLQTQYRKMNQEYERLQHLAKTKLDAAAEAELDAKTAKWKGASQDMLRDLLSMTKKMNRVATMTELLGQLRIRPEQVGWNEDEDDFVD